MIKDKIIQIGQGCGKGEIVDALPRKEIEDIIERLDVTECYKMAYENYIQGFKDGVCCIDLITGDIYGFSIGQRESNQACDNNYIELVRVSQNEEDPYYVEDWQMEDEIKEYIKNAPQNDIEGLDINMTSESFKEINPDIWYKIYDDLYAENMYSWESNLDFDWDYIEEELDIRYNM